MADIEALKNSVLEQARQTGQQRFLEAQEQIKEDFEHKKTQLLGTKESDFQQRIKDLKQVHQAECQQIKNKERQSTLVAKQAILQELFQAAYQTMADWFEETELAFIRGVLDKYSEESAQVAFGQVTLQKLGPSQVSQLQLAYPHMTFDQESIAQEAGLVVSLGRVDDNYLYRHLVDSVYKAESSRIANEIFTR